jgi:hypothetical protein
VATRHSHIRLLGRHYAEVSGGEQQQAEMIFAVSDGKDDDGLSGESEEKKELVGLGTSVGGHSRVTWRLNEADFNSFVGCMKI